MQPVPMLFGEEPFEVGFGLVHAVAIAEPPALGQPVNVGIHREGGHAKGL